VFDKETGRRRRCKSRAAYSEETDAVRKIFLLLNLIGLLYSLNHANELAKTVPEIPVEVLEVKDLGLSDRDESKSVLEVSWRVGQQIQKEKIAAFNLVLSVTYADGTTIVERRKFERTVFSARIEVPSIKPFGNRSSAFIKKTEARVTATVFKN
jgi:hypothetical protein